LKKKLFMYFIAAIVIFMIVLFVGVFGVKLTWGESALLSAFLTAVGVVSYWRKEEVGW